MTSLASLRTWLSNLGRSQRATVQPAAGTLLWVCQGRQGYRHGMGRGLFATEPVFRDTVLRGSRVIEDCGYPGIVDLFERDMPPLHERDDEFRSIVSHGLVHLGLIDLWRSKGVQPDGVVGLSLGEITSAYAAGMLSLEDTMSVVRIAGLLDERVVGYGRLIVVFASRADADAICAASPADLGVFAEFGPRTTVLFCPKEEVEICVADFEANGIGHHMQVGDYGYHTPRFRAMRQPILDDLADLSPMTAQLPFYSGMMGALADRWVSADGPYWYWMTALPVQFNSAVEAALRDGSRVALHIGPEPSIAAYVDEAAQRLDCPLESIASLRSDRDEADAFGVALARLRALGLVGTPDRAQVALRSKPDQSVDFEAAYQDPFPLIERLRSAGPVHWLERHGYWLVLSAQAVREALANPQIFTSSPAAGLDPVLLAAGPDAHPRPSRNLSSQFGRRLPIAEQAAAEAVSEILDGLERRRELDLVDGLAIPVAHRMAGALLGLEANELEAVGALTRSDLYGLSYVPALQEWFAGIATGDPPTESLAARIMAGEDDLSAKELAHLLTLCWVAGTTTSAMLIGSAARMMIYDTALHHELGENPALVPNLVEEAMRLESPEQTLWRRTSSAVELGGATIPAGAEVRLHLGAANRDPDVVKYPDLLHLSDPPGHIGFGSGLHACLGAGLARSVARLTVNALLGLDLRPVVPVNKLEYVKSNHFRGLVRLPVRLR